MRGSKTIERAARKLCKSVGEEESEWPEWAEAAEAGIAEMREPSEMMTGAGADFFEESSAADNVAAAAIVFQTMIDAALAEND
jgi:hypothetical protein